jgi:general secretion pathway protein K
VDPARRPGLGDLVLDTFRNAPYTSLDQAWATPLADTRLDQYIERERVEGENFDASLSGGITDATSRYNLRNLADNRVTVPEQVEIFQRLLSNLQLDQSLALKVAQFVASGQTRQATGEQDLNSKGINNSNDIASGVSGSPVKLLQVDDLLAIQGVKQAFVERLRPFVIVLPEKTPVNVNTAPAEVLAAVIPKMSVSEANTLIVQRKQAPWNDAAKFIAQLGESRTVATDAVSIKSDWFLIGSRIRLDRAGLDAEALIRRASGLQTGNSTRVVWIRQY